MFAGGPRKLRCSTEQREGRDGLSMSCEFGGEIVLIGETVAREDGDALSVELGFWVSSRSFPEEKRGWFE